MDKWFHISEKLPEIGQDCIGWLDFGEDYEHFCDMEFVRHVGHGFFDRHFGGRLVELTDNQEINYWMPLPEPPK